MTLTAEATIDVAATPREVLEFVLDFDDYRKVDPKIVRGRVTGPDEAGKGSVKLLARMRGLPPAPDVHDFDLQRWLSLTFRRRSQAVRAAVLRFHWCRGV